MFFFIFVIAFIAGIFLEKLRGALIGAGLCMLVTVTLFVALAPRGPKYVDDQVEGADGAGYNFLGQYPIFAHLVRRIIMYDFASCTDQDSRTWSWSLPLCVCRCRC